MFAQTMLSTQKRRFTLLFSTALFAVIAAAQPASSPSFEVASVKVSAPLPSDGRIFLTGPRGGPGTTDPTQITWSNATLQNVVTNAFDIKNYQLNSPSSINGWLNSERYDFVVKVPDGATKDQVRLMWQRLLAERFGMVVHHESKEFQVEELVVGKNGHKLKETTQDPNAPPADGPPKIDGGVLKSPGMVTMINLDPTKGARATATAVAQNLAPLATMLSSQRGHPVVDKTGLTGKYDFTLTFAPNLSGLALAPGGDSKGALPSPNDPGSEEDLASAIQTQLGLRLVSGKAPLDTVIIEKLAKVPTEN